ncbi:MAG: adenylyl-sulfate kinase [Candidatus Methylomirabilales bacterium]
MVLWLIGLAGAGKSVIGREVYARLKARRPNVAFLDGDHVRAIMGSDLGYSLEDRRANAWRVCRLCQFLDGQGIDVVCAILSLFHETQEWNRHNYSSYFEVYIDVLMSVLIQRDQKGLYSGALAGTLANVVGIDIPFTPPKWSDLIIENDDSGVSAEALADQIVAAIDSKFAETR